MPPRIQVLMYLCIYTLYSQHHLTMMKLHLAISLQAT
jgi:hypothetical protein